MKFYKEAFQRNIGVFSEQEQNKIKDLKVVIAGCGGMGGQAAQQFVRLGVENFKVADFDVYNVCNINNQFDSNVDTMGKNKAEVVAKNIKLINPYAKVTFYNEGLTSKNVEEFVDCADIVVDAIDYNNQKDSLMLHREAKKNNLYVFTAQAIGFGASLLVFDPNGITLEEYLGSDVIKSNKIPAEKFSPIIPSYADPKIIRAIEKQKIDYLPNIGSAQSLGIAMLTAEVLNYILKDKAPTCVPSIFAIDLWDKKIVS
jgi:tRNA threonylcarbamoyladenosine dehydratase